MVTALESLVGHPVRVWQVTNQATLREVIPRGGPPTNCVEFRDGALVPRDDQRIVGPVDGMPGYWYELEVPNGAGSGRDFGRIIGSLLASEADAIDMAGELADRYEEIDLLYTIAETIGRTVSLSDACRRILREVCAVVGAARGSILVSDPSEEILTPVAGFGIDVAGFEPIRIADTESIAARVFRERRTVSLDPSDPNATRPSHSEQRSYTGSAYLSVPILYPESDGNTRTVGVISLTNREGLDAFSTGHTKLVSAIANQIGATIENSRLLAREKERERVNHELSLARDLQKRLLPTFHRENGFEVAGRCEPTEFVGGDFYKVFDLPNKKVGVLLGDVSSHGFSAALMMARVLSAAGIYAEADEAPEKALNHLFNAVAAELRTAEMHFSVFFGVVDPQCGCLRYANAGHPHVFLLRDGDLPRRLGASSPPLGLTDEVTVIGEKVDWHPGKDVLLLFSDGVSDSQAEDGTRFGEENVVRVCSESVAAPAGQIVENIFNSLAEYGGSAPDDQTVLILKA